MLTVMNFQAITLKVDSACFATNNFTVWTPISWIDQVVSNPTANSSSWDIFRNSIRNIGESIENGLGGVNGLVCVLVCVPTVNSLSPKIAMFRELVSEKIIICTYSTQVSSGDLFPYHLARYISPQLWHVNF